MIQAYNITMEYNKESRALDNVTLKVPKGDFVYVTGPSGAGKSTLLKLLYSEERPGRGQVLIDGQNMTRMRPKQIALLRRRIGVVFQDFKLLTRRTIYENVAFPLEIQGKKRYEVSKKVYQTLKMVGLDKKLHKFPLELSGGEQQRVAIARALVVDPLILLADEPTGNLDYDLGLEIMEHFKGANARGSTVIFATHDRELMVRHPRRKIRLESGKLVSDQIP